jgi:hypothetical protein
MQGVVGRALSANAIPDLGLGPIEQRTHFVQTVFTIPFDAGAIAKRCPQRVRASSRVTQPLALLSTSVACETVGRLDPKENDIVIIRRCRFVLAGCKRETTRGPPSRADLKIQAALPR